MKVQIELPEDVNQKVEVYKAEHRLKDKRKAIVEMLREFVKK